MDNYFQECPPKGMDSRHFTDYKTATRRNEHIKYINGEITRDDEYRLMLQKNGSEILRNTFNHHKQNNYCGASTCVHTYPTRMAPSKFAEEMAKYNAKASGKATADMKCQAQEDYTSSEY